MTAQGSGVLRLVYCISLCLLILAFLGCSGLNKSSTPVPEQNDFAGITASPSPGQDRRDIPPTKAIALYEALNELQALPVPSGVDSALFEQLKNALKQVLESEGAGLFECYPPTALFSAVDDLTVVSDIDGTASLSWTYRNKGDYDQNSEVNMGLD